MIVIMIGLLTCVTSVVYLFENSWGKLTEMPHFHICFLPQTELTSARSTAVDICHTPTTELDTPFYLKQLLSDTNRCVVVEQMLKQCLG